MDECAILVPKNRQVKAAITILRDMGLSVAAATSLQLFELADTQALLNVLHIIVEPFNTGTLARSLLDPISGITPLDAHQFLQQVSARKITLEAMLDADDDTVKMHAKKLEHWLELSADNDAYSLIQIIAEDCMLNTATDDETLRHRIEIIRTLLHLALSQAERGQGVDLASYIEFIDRLQEYDEDIPLAVFGANKGIKVLTLHGSKGLEFDAVWIAHMDERSLMGTKRNAFTLPEIIEEKFAEEDGEVKKRQLYVALTRAKRFCTLSYSRQSYSGGDQQLASIIAALPESSFLRETAEENENAILQSDEKLYATSKPLVETYDITELVREEYPNRSVSVTMLNNFFECPWKWYFRNLLQLPEPLNDSLHVGTVVHAGIEYILKSSSAPSQLMLTAEIERRATLEARYNEAHAYRLAAQALPIVTNWMEVTLPMISQPFSTEKSLPYHDPAFPNLSMFGKIDLVEEIISNEVRVTDWKTGSVKTGNEIEKPDPEGRMSGLLRQLAMYSYLINGFSKSLTEVTESRLVFLEAKKNDKNSLYTRHILNSDLERLHADIADYDRLLQSGEWTARPCHAKLYGEGEHCEYCAMARRFGVVINS